jgi:hypothetical protein
MRHHSRPSPPGCRTSKPHNSATGRRQTELLDRRGAEISQPTECMGLLEVDDDLLGRRPTHQIRPMIGGNERFYRDEIGYSPAMIAELGERKVI